MARGQSPEVAASILRDWDGPREVRDGLAEEDVLPPAGRFDWKTGIGTAVLAGGVEWVWREGLSG